MNVTRCRSPRPGAIAALASHVALALLLFGSTTLAARAEDAKKEEKPAKKLPEMELKPVVLEPGAYEVKVSMEDADGAAIGLPLIETHCLSENAGVAMHGFAALGPDSPLRNCPAADLRETGDSLSFAIRCTGGNSAKGRAYFTVFGPKFRGRIEIAPDGRGTPIAAEIQEGRRIASCPAP